MLLYRALAGGMTAWWRRSPDHRRGGAGLGFAAGALGLSSI
ncbi:hypothetical protein [Micromonospora sp. NPDC049301]